MTTREFKNMIRNYMIIYLENMCHYADMMDWDTSGEYATKTDAVRNILENEFLWDIESETEYVKKLFRIKKEYWW